MLAIDMPGVLRVPIGQCVFPHALTACCRLPALFVLLPADNTARVLCCRSCAFHVCIHTYELTPTVSQLLSAIFLQCISMANCRPAKLLLHAADTCELIGLHSHTQQRNLVRSKEANPPSSRNTHKP